jgi:hypothetical protein
VERKEFPALSTVVVVLEFKSKVLRADLSCKSTGRIIGLISNDHVSPDHDIHNKQIAAISIAQLNIDILGHLMSCCKGQRTNILEPLNTFLKHQVHAHHHLPCDLFEKINLFFSKSSYTVSCTCLAFFHFKKSAFGKLSLTGLTG